METTEQLVPEHYNPHQLVTYKVITDGNASYPTSKVTDLEWKLEQSRRDSSRLVDINTKIYRLEDNLVSWIENDESAETIVSEICDLFGFNPTKEISFEATATITGTISIPLKDLADFDIDSLDLSVSVDSYEYNIDADVEIDHVSRLD
jgi:hypothetical protein